MLDVVAILSMQSNAAYSIPQGTYQLQYRTLDCGTLKKASVTAERKWFCIVMYGAFGEHCYFDTCIILCIATLQWAYSVWLKCCSWWWYDEVWRKMPSVRFDALFLWMCAICVLSWEWSISKQRKTETKSEDYEQIGNSIRSSCCGSICFGSFFVLLLVFCLSDKTFLISRTVFLISVCASARG